MEPGFYWARLKLKPRQRKQRPWALAIVSDDGEDLMFLRWKTCHGYPYRVADCEFGPRIPDYKPEEGKKPHE